jgi:adenylylsulfate kinase
MVIWIIGLSGAGKTTLAKRICVMVREKNIPVVHIDGDLIRDLFNNDLGYTKADRYLNALRLGKIVSLLAKQEIHVVCSALSLFEDTRQWNRQNIKKYYEVFVDSTLTDLVSRDTKGLYEKFRKGLIKNIVGLDIDFEIPIKSNLVIKNNQSKKEFLKNAVYLSNLIIQDNI